MTHPAVDFVLDAIKSNWSAGAYADIPLERTDRDNNKLFDAGVRDLTPELQDTNHVGARLADRDATPIGTDYGHRLEAVVSVRATGLHEGDYGYIDPDASLPPATAGDPVPWHELVDEIRDTILAERTFPDTGQADINYCDLQIATENPTSSDFGDFYQHDFDVLFRGYEEL